MTAMRMLSAGAAASAARTGSTKLSGPVTGHEMLTVSVRRPVREPSHAYSSANGPYAVDRSSSHSSAPSGGSWLRRIALIASLALSTSTRSSGSLALTSAPSVARASRMHAR